MANLDKTVSIIFSGIDKTGDVFAGLSRNLSSFSGKVDTVAEPLSKLADGVLGLDAALATMAAAGLAVSINQAGKFSDSFKEITTLIDETGGSVDQFRDDILSYSRDSKKSLEDIEAALYSAKSAGVDYQYALDVIADSEKLSIGAKADLDATTKVLASTMNTYGASIGEASQYSDILFTTVKQGVTTLPELSTTLAQVTGIASSAGIPFDTLAAAIAALTAYGQPTSQAITQIKAAISNIISPSEKAKAATEDLKGGFGAAALKAEGFEGILKKVYEATGGNVDKMAELFGSTEALNAALILGEDKSNRFKNALDAMASSTGAANTAYQKMADGFKDTNQNLANNIKATFVQIGLELIDNYVDIVKSISETFKSVGVSIDAGAFDEVFDALNGFGDDIEQFFKELAESLPEALAAIDWSGFLDALGDLGDSIGSMFDGFDPSDPEDVSAAIQFVVDSIETLIRVTGGLVAGFEPFIQAILNSVDAFNKMNSTDKEVAGNIIALGKAVTALGVGLTALMLAVGNNADDIKTAFEVVAGSIELGWGALKSGIQSIALLALKDIDRILAAAEMVTFGDWDTKIKAARKSIQETMNGIEDRLFNSVDNVHDGWNRIVDAFSEGADKAKSEVGHSLKDIFYDWEDLMPTIDPTKFFDWSNFEELSIEPTLETRTFEENLAIVEQKMDEFKALNSKVDIVFTADKDPVEEFFSYLEDEFSNVYSLDFSGKNLSENLPDLEFKTTYKWTDANGGLHITDTPPDPGDAIGDIEEIAVPVKTKPDKDSVKDTIKKIKSEVTNAKVGGINIGVNISGPGVGPAGDGDLKSYFEENIKNVDVDLSDLFDPSGMADLFDALNEATDPHDLQQARRAIEQQLQLQKQAIDAQTRLTNAQAAVAEDMVSAADIMWQTASVDDKTIKIEAAGVEPEIEAFMWKILKKIQVRANKSGAEFLLAAAG
ncbi:phage tail tape measure protein, TP901 family [delta proteobacterium NaphS2]|nr:phage tail tape measure protein, TP901 family [delta proteobacterium NaphS2]